MGTIGWACPGLSSKAVHPHMRGDNDFIVDVDRQATGSPPHAWGQWFVVVVQHFLHRFTPTCVGTISPAWPPSARLPVHPHMRGDNAFADGFHLDSVRFTPTCVGTIASRGCTSASGPVHPHMRGDNLHALCLTNPAYGSPPHAWGQFIQ